MPRSIDARRALIEALTLVRRAQMEARKGVVRLSRIAGRVEGGREMLVSLETLSLVLERVALRINTILVTGVVSRELLLPVVAIVRELYEQSRDLGPGIAQALSELDDILETVSSATLGEPPVHVETQAREEARKVIEEARREAERRLEGPVGLGT